MVQAKLQLHRTCSSSMILQYENEPRVVQSDNLCVSKVA